MFFTHSRIIIARHIVSLAIFICCTCVWFTNLIIWVTVFRVCTIFIILTPYILPFTNMVRNCILPLTHNLLLVSHLKLSPWQSSFVVHDSLQTRSIRSHPSFGPLQSSFELQPKHYIIDYVVRNCILPVTHSLLLVSHLMFIPILRQSQLCEHVLLQMWSERSHFSFFCLQSSFELHPKHNTLQQRCHKLHLTSDT